MRKPSPTRWWIVVALCVVAAALAPSSRAASHGTEIRVTINEPFGINDQVFDGGEVALRELGHYSPVATMNEILVDGRSLGIWLARLGTDAREAATSALVFDRAADGMLWLTGVEMRGEPTRDLCRFADSSDGGWINASTGDDPTRPEWMAASR